jgi:hypothetical protein
MLLDDIHNCILERRFSDSISGFRNDAAIQDTCDRMLIIGGSCRERIDLLMSTLVLKLLAAARETFSN